MNGRRGFVAIVVAVALLAGMGCGGKPEDAVNLDISDVAQAEPDSTSEVTAQEEPAADVARFEDLFKKKPEEEIQPPEPPPPPVLVLEDVHFGFDKYSLTAEARRALAKHAEGLKDRATLRIQIEGHCDEHGTQEYNLALGQRRAQAARDYLVNLGVDPSRISIISYGEERPLDPRSNEEAWTKNRRAHFKKR